MNIYRTLFTLAFIGFVTSLLAQSINNWTHLNAVDKEQAQKAASQLVIGMSEKDAIRLLATSGLRTSGGGRDTSRWVRNYCFTNGSCDLKLEFRQKPGPTGLVMEANAGSSGLFTLETTNPFVAMTNGILHAALLHNIQIARTNAP